MSSNGPPIIGSNQASANLNLSSAVNDLSSQRPSSDADVQEWERRLLSGDETVPDDFLQITEPSRNGNSSGQTSMMSAGSSVTANATATLSGPPGTASAIDTSDDAPLVDLSTPNDTENHSSTQASPLPKKEKRPMTTEENDHAMALALQRQLQLEDEEQAAAARAGAAMGGGGVPFMTQAMAATPPPNSIGRLTVTVAEAKLARNYGLTRMDPYCRVRVGHCVYETPTSPNGAREPKWNRTFNCYLLKGVKVIDVEIYDECTFQSDSMVAHTTFSLPEEVITKGMVVDEWWPLSGQEGHDKEGMIHIILSLQPLSQQPAGGTTSTIQMMPGQTQAVIAVPSNQAQQGQQGQQGQQVARQPRPLPKLSDEQLEEFSKMFPNVDKDVISSVFQENLGNQEATINSLLLLSGS